MNESIQTVANILRISPKDLAKMNDAMTNFTHNNSVFDDIVFENNQAVERVKRELHVTSGGAPEVMKAIEDLLSRNDAALFDILGKPDLSDQKQSELLIQKSYEAVGGKPKGLFLKKEKARQMLSSTPPPVIMRGLGYMNIEELLANEKLEEVFAALRFIETRDWMNTVFVKQYEALTPQDFEEREVEAFVLSKKWLALAKKFVEKKYHNVSHLKELGVIFVIPIELGTPGETIRLFSLLLHYLYEVPFYSLLIKVYSADPGLFSFRLISLIRGDVGKVPVETVNGFVRWLIVQRYLAKDDEKDPRLFVPHVNPEAIHWRKAQHALVAFAANHSQLSLSMFKDLDYAGAFFLSKENEQLFVSFDLVDNIMGLVKRKEDYIKYLYHHREALWNRIFVGFMGEEKLEELIKEHLNEGYIEVTA